MASTDESQPLGLGDKALLALLTVFVAYFLLPSTAWFLLYALCLTAGVYG
jgi:hypothetical protein